MLSKDKICIYTIFFSGIVLLIYKLHPRHYDFERYFLNKKNNKFKYYILLYAKYILIFAFVYNLKYILLNYLKKK